MCGIAAQIGAAASLAVIERMIARVAHRGPDGKGIAELTGCVLGHTRLSIIDLATGMQPMADVSGRYHISFNGEIYNYRELRAELGHLGVAFQTRSDTEVILAAYGCWGAECVHRFRGMFAFIIWDAVTKSAFAARDLFGEKPLYYALAGDGSLLVASEIKGLLASGLLTPRLDLECVDAYLALGYVPPDRTIYRNVRTLPPAHWLKWRDGVATVERYWQPTLESRPISLGEAAEQLRILVRNAVQRQMVADVPVGAFLSGGLDSSTIVACMREGSQRPVKTFSVGFGEYINELPYARAVADVYGTEHHEIDLGTPPIGELLKSMANIYDEPFADTSNVPVYLISEYARRSVKVVLSGDGGDEIFGGYAWYLPLAESEGVRGSRAEWMALRILSRLLQERIRGLHRYSVALGLAARWSDMWLRAAMSNVCFRETDRRRLWGERLQEIGSFVPGDYFRPSAVTTGLNRGFYFDLTSYLPGDILVKVDRAAMAHGLETRAPFLDRDLVEFALSLPAPLKVRGDREKRVLREAFSTEWPPAVRQRSKQGFGSPCDVWLARSDVRALWARVMRPDSRLSELLPGLRSRRYNSSYQTWVLLTLGLWLDAWPFTP